MVVSFFEKDKIKWDAAETATKVSETARINNEAELSQQKEMYLCDKRKDGPHKKRCVKQELCL